VKIHFTLIDWHNVSEVTVLPNVSGTNAWGYRTVRLSESAVRQMLGFETRMEVHVFVKQHGVYLHYDVADLEQDQVTAEKLRGRLQAVRGFQ
jgi:Uncharacterised protein family (UPF0175)